MKKTMSRTVVQILLLCQIVLGAKAQPLPQMFVDKATTNYRIMQFSNIEGSKYEALRKQNGYQDLFFIYSNTAVKNLLDYVKVEKGIRIYIALYNASCDKNNLPNSIEDNKVILLFSPGYNLSKPKTERFYFINDKEKNNSIIEVDKDCAQNWIDSYNESDQNVLLPTLLHNDPGNRHPDRANEFSDTRSIFFPLDSLKEATIVEEGYSHKIRGQEIKITGYKFSFSAYDSLGTVHNRTDTLYKNRLLLQFDYMYGPATKHVFYLDDLDNFENRLTKALIKRQRIFGNILKKEKYKFISDAEVKVMPLSKKIETLKLIDNGQLCPTYCPK